MAHLARRTPILARRPGLTLRLWCLRLPIYRSEFIREKRQERFYLITNKCQLAAVPKQGAYIQDTAQAHPCGILLRHPVSKGPGPCSEPAVHHCETVALFVSLKRQYSKSDYMKVDMDHVANSGLV